MPTTRNERDACDLFDQDHEEVKKLFKECEGLAGSKSRTSMKRKQELMGEVIA